MIKSFANKETEKIWLGKRSDLLPNEIQGTARRLLRILNNAQNFEDLSNALSGILEKQSGTQMAFYHIRINKGWIISFIWNNGGAYEIEILKQMG